MHTTMTNWVLVLVLTALISGFTATKDSPCTQKAVYVARKLKVIAGTDPTCKNGIIRGKVCCDKSCGSCGGSGCSRRPGGAKKCCTGVISTLRRMCNRYMVPCIIEIFEPPLYMEYPVQEDYVPIISYHRIGGPPSVLRTTVERFHGQVEYLTNVVGCNWITMERLSEYIRNKEKVPTKACVMTFDDGIAFQYHNALCTLNKFKVPATYYLITSFVGWKSYYLTWEEVEKLHRMGHDIEAHTETHADLSRLNFTEQEHEILGCKNVLEKTGYTVKTFAYPYGDYNTNTFSILRNSDYVLARDTKVDKDWKNPKTMTINQNKDYLLHFYYIRPEIEDGIDLWERIKYTGWWQFEDNYEIVKGSKKSVFVLGGGSKYLPTNSSHGLLRLSRRNNEISTQFLTKHGASFTLYLVVGGNTKKTLRFEVKVDGVMYNVYAAETIYRSRHVRYYGFYVNIRSLLPGVHTLNIINNAGRILYLDKFRISSNVAQDFKDSMYYKTCDPEVDDYCQCESVK